MDDQGVSYYNGQDAFPSGRGGVTAPMGFTAYGMHAGIRKSGKKDFAVLLAEEAVPAAAVFTKNRVQAAPVTVSAQHLQQGGNKLRAIVMNSGVANAATGERGLRDARATAEAAAQLLQTPVEHIAVASTGLIGVFLPLENMKEALPACIEAADRAGHLAAAEAIMTTDTFRKEAACQRTLSDGTEITIGAMVKGAGMIDPDMATMLAFATTDARVDAATLAVALRRATDDTFNMISVDGDTSTNDAVFLMASGRAGGTAIETDSADFEVLVSGLTEIFTVLAKAIVQDGEGATRIMEVKIDGAASEEEARQAARTITRSTLVKAALFGGDANWGRILAALGASEAQFHPDQVDLHIAGMPVVQAGRPVTFDTAAMNKALAGEEIAYTLHLHAGEHSATAWGCDITYEYIRINAEYRT